MTDETTPPAIIQTANQPIDLTPSVAHVDSPSFAESVGIAAKDLRKEAENDAKQHINSIWQRIETWTHEQIMSLIFDLKKHL